MSDPYLDVFVPSGESNTPQDMKVARHSGLVKLVETRERQFPSLTRAQIVQHIKGARLSMYSVAWVLWWVRGGGPLASHIWSLPNQFVRVALKFPAGCETEERLFEPVPFWLLRSLDFPGEWVGYRGNQMFSLGLSDWVLLFRRYLLAKIAAMDPEKLSVFRSMMMRSEAVLDSKCYRHDGKPHFCWVVLQQGMGSDSPLTQSPICGGVVLPLCVMEATSKSGHLLPVWPLCLQKMRDPIYGEVVEMMSEPDDICALVRASLTSGS